ncbi:DUF305 domain-containing protein [Gloeocapsopsis sp. IPPAS B-1203]|uniref:DUF305 domain-containing protein n=1 Tax=Gloeocapsopsis sp. IPPAS B-1203 TaxID=2049454 RepID=UPI000C1995C8|nr:DUF305 domain-containing protein [Gloeocapsopsis sp. IPPAS B-1203]PIG90583.1 DUF305 domain-containing protein [Gloeocapsopsis sp. IPPAS B-1203]
MLKKSILYGLVGVLAGSAIPALIVSGRANSQALQSSPCNMTMHSAMAGRQQQHFIEMMIPHHQEAVDMAELALAKAQRPEIRKLAESIKTEQTREIEQMRSWYKKWYGTEVPATTMTGMEMRHGRGQRMQGMAMRSPMMSMDMESLRTASDFDREFIRQMIPHHRSAIMMARMVANRAERPEIRNLAQTIIQSQSAEINQMQQWYQAWYQ